MPFSLRARLLSLELFQFPRTDSISANKRPLQPLSHQPLSSISVILTEDTHKPRLLPSISTSCQAHRVSALVFDHPRTSHDNSNFREVAMSLMRYRPQFIRDNKKLPPVWAQCVFPLPKRRKNPNSVGPPRIAQPSEGNSYLLKPYATNHGRHSTTWKQCRPETLQVSSASASTQLETLRG